MGSWAVKLGALSKLDAGWCEVTSLATYADGNVRVVVSKPEQG
jgi:hypothetical protein